MPADDAVLIGRAVADQRTLRMPEAIRDLDTFIEFLVNLEDVFGPLRRPVEPTLGNNFRI